MAVSKSMPTAWIRSDVWAAANTSLSAGSSVSPAEITNMGCLYMCDFLLEHGAIMRFRLVATASIICS